MLRKKVTTDP